jgi:membrane-associated phospholipid phosphatase
MVIVPKNTVENWISSLAIAYIGIPLFVFVVFGNMIALRIASLILLADAITVFIKYTTRDITWGFLKRPLGATDCNTLMNDGSVAGRSGFPSGHTATSAAFWTYMYYLTPTEYQLYTGIAGTVWTSIMAWARMKKYCHTFLQTVAGAFVGWAVVYIYWIL